MEPSKNDFKVEMKPSFWVVTLEHGEYSDWTIDNLYFHANDELEVWNFLCRYAEAMYPEDRTSWALGGSTLRALKWDVEGGEPKLYAVKKWTDAMEKEQRVEKEEINWDTGYGDAKLVTISRLNVIEFQR